MIDLSLLMPEFQTRLHNFIYDAQNEGFDVDIESGYRSIAEQNRLYTLGRNVKNPDGYDPIVRPMGDIVTDAKGGQSWHNFGVAADVVFRTNGTWDWNRPSIDYLNLAKIAEEYDLKWGGNWVGVGKSLGDFDHFEAHGNLTLAQAQSLKNLEEVWDAIRND